MEESVVEEREADCGPIKALGKPVWVLESSACWEFSSQPGTDCVPPCFCVELEIGKRLRCAPLNQIGPSGMRQQCGRLRQRLLERKSV